MTKVHHKVLPPSPDPASLADLNDFIRVASEARKQGNVQREAAARWAARTQDRLRIIQCAMTRG